MRVRTAGTTRPPFRLMPARDFSRGEALLGGLHVLDLGEYGLGGLLEGESRSLERLRALGEAWLLVFHRIDE